MDREEYRDSKMEKIRKRVKMKRVAITGPTGAIGNALIHKCIDENIEVYAFVRKNSSRISHIPKSKLVHVIYCGLEELKDFPSNQIAQCDVFYHMGWGATIGAGRDDMEVQVQNIKYTLDAIHLAKKLGCHTFIGTGSQAEYGRYEGKLDETVPTFPENGYGIAKLCAGQMAKIECAKLELRYVWVRILSVYGPYDNENTMVASTIKKLLEGIRPMFTKGEQEWDYLYSYDAAQALILLGKKENAKGIYCLGSGKTRKLSEYIYEIKKAAKSEIELGMGEIPYADKQVMYLCANINRLQEDTGYHPEVDFEEGIKKTVKWMTERLEHEES